jgi:hypothetical protein
MLPNTSGGCSMPWKKSNAAIAIGIIAVATAVCGLAGYIIAQWSVIESNIKPAIISGAFTIVAAMGGALVIFWQLRKQAENTVKSNLQSEKLKLVKEIYEDLLDACHEVHEAAATLDSYVQDFYRYVGRQKEVVEVAKMAPTPPTQRYQEVAELVTDIGKKLLRIIRLARRWEITDPRLRVFKFAMNAATYEINEALKEYQVGTVPLLPADEGILKNMGWEAPNEAGLKRLGEVTDVLRFSLDYARYWTTDLQTECQNLFIGELFGTKISPRPRAPEHTPMVITLEKSDELVEYILKETAFGKHLTPQLVEFPLSTFGRKGGS